jgi:hypothetical protein
MTSQPKPLRISLAIRVNGLEFREVTLRRSVENHRNWEVVIKDRCLGCFALHEDFQLEIRPAEGVETDWRQISLGDLRIAALEVAQNGAWDLEEVVPETCGQRDGTTKTECGIMERIPVDGDASHVHRLSEALSRARIRFQMVGGLGSRGQTSGHVALEVSSLLAARVCLCRAGFLQSPESKCVLIDSRTGWKVRLFEERPRAVDGREP